MAVASYLTQERDQSVIVTSSTSGSDSENAERSRQRKENYLYVLHFGLFLVLLLQLLVDALLLMSVLHAAKTVSLFPLEA